MISAAVDVAADERGTPAISHRQDLVCADGPGALSERRLGQLTVTRSTTSADPVPKKASAGSWPIMLVPAVIRRVMVSSPTRGGDDSSDGVGVRPGLPRSNHKVVVCLIWHNGVVLQ